MLIRSKEPQNTAELFQLRGSSIIVQEIFTYVVADIYSFLPVYGSSRWYDRKGAVDENAFIKILQDVNLKVTCHCFILSVSVHYILLGSRRWM